MASGGASPEQEEVSRWLRRDVRVTSSRSKRTARMSPARKSARSQMGWSRSQRAGSGSVVRKRRRKAQIDAGLLAMVEDGWLEPEDIEDALDPELAEEDPA